MQVSSLFFLVLALLCATISTATAQLPSTDSGWIVLADATREPTASYSLRAESERAQALSLNQAESETTKPPQEADAEAASGSGIVMGAVGALAIAAVVAAVVYKAKTRRGPLLPVGALPSPTTPTA